VRQRRLPRWRSLSERRPGFEQIGYFAGRISDFRQYLRGVLPQSGRGTPCFGAHVRPVRYRTDKLHSAGGVVLLLNFGPFKDWFRNSKAGRWTTSIGFKALAPFLFWFALFACFDVLIQGLASRAFGIDIDWWALAARLPILYSVLALPSFGNFGTRELTWAASFSDFAPHDTLVAYALATNTVFLMLHVVIGVIFLPRAIRLISEMRRAQREGETVRVPILRKTSEP